MPAFGNQPILTTKIDSEKVIAQKILGTTKYKLTPGDSYKIIVQVRETITQPLILDENYLLEIPFLGTVDVRGMYFSELRQLIIKRIKAKMVVDFVDFVLVAPALFDIFIYGGVENPGIATVTPVNTLWEAIVLAKGFKKGGSYRQIALERGGETFVCDLGKYIGEGDLSQNMLLEPGDRIYIPHAEIMAKIDGNVLYPDTYELVPGETMADLIRIAGGLRPDADRKHIKVVRMTESRSFTMIDLTYEAAETVAVQNGDQMKVASFHENSDMILVEGALYGRPTSGTEPQPITPKPIVINVPYIPEMTLLEVLEEFGGPTPLADAEKSLVIRKRTGEKIPVDVRRLWESRSDNLDILLEPRDHVYVPMVATKVVVAGKVNTPGAFPYVTDSIVSDYIMMAGGIIPEEGDANRIFLLDTKGKKAPLTLESEVEPGYLIYVDQTAWEYTKYTLDQITVVIGFAAASLALVLSIYDLIDVFY
ncbi:MAG: SLBB domain-containing protein [Spirochaetales bacterium]|nr:SLBB domain-containing protein [Spirochaetales bacterium]